MKNPTRSAASDTVVVTVLDPETLDHEYLARALALARGLGCGLAFVHVAWNPHAAHAAFGARFAAREVDATLRRDAHLALERWCARARRAGVPAAAVVLLGWPASDHLVRYAVRTRPRLVLARSPRRSAAGRIFRPYHDWELLRALPAPLLLVRAGGAADGPVLAAVDPVHPREGAAQLDERVVATAAEVSAALGAPLHLLHVDTLPRELVVGTVQPRRVAVPARLRTERRRLARAGLARLGEAHGVGSRRQHVVEGVAVDALLAQARRREARVLVLGVVSRRFLKRAILGSTAEGVLREAPCDLLLVKPEGFRPVLGGLG